METFYFSAIFLVSILNGSYNRANDPQKLSGSDVNVAIEIMNKLPYAEKINKIFYSNNNYVIKNCCGVIEGSFYKNDGKAIFGRLLTEPKDNSEIINNNLTFI
jgi:hypothetical protein